MPLIPWADMRSPQPLRSQPLAPLANALRRGACEMRRANPGLFRSPLLQPSALERRARGISGDVWDSICDDVPLPPGEAYDLPFGGGRCVTLYQVIAFVDLTNGLTASQAFNNIPGPLSGLRWITVNNSATSQSHRFRLVDRNGVETVNSVFTGQPQQVAGRRFQIIRQDGLPDDCPVPPEPDPPPIVEINNPVDIDINLGGQTVNVPITLNDYSVGPDNSVNWSPTFNVDGVDFSIEPGGVNIHFDPKFSFAPEVSVNLPGGQIGGAVAEGLDVLSELLDLINTILQRIPEDGGTTGPCDLTPVLDLINCYLGETDVQYSTESIVVNPVGGTATIPANTVALLFELDTPATNATRTQNGSGAAPGVIYWGWFAVGRGEPGERRELQYARQSVIIPKESTTLVFNPIHNNVGTVSAIVKTLNCS